MLLGMKKTARGHSKTASFSAVKIIGGIFRVRRDLVGAIKRRVLGGSGLNIEEVDLLLDLFGAAELGWQDPSADAQGFVTFQDLQSSLVHSPALLSRRIASMRAKGWIDSCQLHTLRSGKIKIDKKAKAARITAAGKRVIEPIYDKYCRFCDEMLIGFPIEELRILQKSNQTIIQRIRGKL